jgi:hypothetical protein
MKVVGMLMVSALLALASSFATAYDPSPLQDFCVGINDADSAGKSFFFLSHFCHFSTFHLSFKIPNPNPT